MITDTLGGKTGAVDTASPAKQAVGRNGDGQGGFSDTLSGLERGHGGQKHDDATTGGERPSAREDHEAAEGKSARKPIIDIRPESLRRSSNENVEQLKQDAARKADEKLLTPAEKKLRDALAAAKAMARKLDEAEGKQGSAKDVANGDVPDVDSSILGADDAKISDVLSLLNGGNMTASEIGAAMVNRGGMGAQGKRSGKDSDERVQDAGVPGSGSKRVSLTRGAGEDGQAMPTDESVDLPGSRQFRFTSARNDSHSVGMSIDGNSRSDRSAEFRQATGGENITVLDSRRFIGLAQNSNSSHLTALLSGDSEWAAAMQPSASLSNAAAVSSTGSVVNTLKLQMNPHDLGSVTATLRLRGEELSVHLTVETRAAYRQLSEDSGGILDALRAQGFAVDQVSISIAASSDSDTSNRQQQQQGQSGQQAAAEGGRQGFSAGRGQGQADDRHTTDQGARTGNDAISENASVSGSGNARPGQLYL